MATILAANEWERTVNGGGDALQQVAPGVARLPIIFINVYLVGEPGGPWVLVDTGLPLTAPRTRAAAEARYGSGARPAAIILTHGHFDHAGSAMELATGWDVPIYAHPLEMPYLTGQSDYPPQDPTIPGAISFMSRLFPHSGYDFGDRVRPLPEDGSVPGMPGWRWLHTPGHSPGQVSLFRDTDRALLAGDALATMDMDSWASQLTRDPEFDRPPAPFTPDWEAARTSVEQLAELDPSVVAAGHGIPMQGERVAAKLSAFAEHFPVPANGRYVPFPARFDREGVVSVPPPAPDPLPRQLAIAGLIAAAVVVIRRPRA
jgi:glyoxylase-like metal-dependent hydrolase (beta-lactamase superfamily II)